MANTWPKMTEIAIVNFFNLFLAGDMKVDRKHTGWFFYWFLIVVLQTKLVHLDLLISMIGGIS